MQSRWDASIAGWVLGYVAAGGLALFAIAGWQRRARQRRQAAVAGVLRELATVLPGQWQVGRWLGKDPFLGELRAYATVSSGEGGLPVTVGVFEPVGEPEDHHTFVKVQRPARERWSLQTLRFRERPPGEALTQATAASLAASFELTPAAAVPAAATPLLLALARRADALVLDADELTLTLEAKPGTIHATDVGELAALVRNMTTLARLLLEPPR